MSKHIAFKTWNKLDVTYAIEATGSIFHCFPTHVIRTEEMQDWFLMEICGGEL
jgi:hypothetical protein